MTVHSNPAPIADVPFPKELIGSRAVIQGASGAGKTYAIRRILETTHGRMQHIVLDVEDELFTLRERFDYVLIGGDGADAPLSEETAGDLATTLLELGVSAILQLNDLGLAGQRRMIAAFLTGLMKAPRRLWHPVLVTLDEAHRYAPQQTPAESSDPIINLTTAGRKRGFGALFATQRLSQLSTNIRGNCPNRIIGRVDQALDRRVAADTLGFSASSAEAKGLMQLAHEFWVVGPAFAPQPRRMRFSPAVTTHLSAGHDDVPPPPTPEKVRALLGRLNRIAAESKPEATQNPSPSLRNQVVAPDPEALRKAESRGYERGRKEGEAAGYEAARARFAAEIAGVAEAVQRLQEALASTGTPPVHVLDPFNLSDAKLDESRKIPKHSDPGDDAASLADALIRTVPPPRKTRANSASAGHVPTAGAMQLLNTAVTHWPVRFTWGQLAALNGRKARGGHFNSCKKFLVDGGFVTERDGKIEPADIGFEKLGVERKKTPRTRAEILDMWFTALPSPAKDILREVAAQPGTATIEDVAGRLGLAPRGGHWNNGVSMLRSNDLIRTSPAGFELGHALLELRP
jgi:hypothetical protein